MSKPILSHSCGLNRRRVFERQPGWILGTPLPKSVFPLLNDLVEASFGVEEMLVDWQLHALGPPTIRGSAAGAAVTWVLLGASAFDVMVESPGAAVPRS